MATQQGALLCTMLLMWCGCSTVPEFAKLPGPSHDAGPEGDDAAGTTDLRPAPDPCGAPRYEPLLPDFERCDGLDNDGDGETDEGWQILVMCGGEGNSRCHSDPRALCDAGRLTSCFPNDPGIEECNGLDDDCDGEVDEGSCISCGVGECQTTVCCNQGMMPACTPPPAQGGAECDCIDHDCNGEVDLAGCAGHPFCPARAELPSFSDLPKAGPTDNQYCVSGAESCNGICQAAPLPPDEAPCDGMGHDWASELPAGEQDQDGDRVPSCVFPSGGGGDCNDHDPFVHPAQAVQPGYGFYGGGEDGAGYCWHPRWHGGLPEVAAPWHPCGDPVDRDCSGAASRPCPGVILDAAGPVQRMIADPTGKTLFISADGDETRPGMLIRVTTATLRVQSDFIRRGDLASRQLRALVLTPGGERLYAADSCHAGVWEIALDDALNLLQSQLRRFPSPEPELRLEQLVWQKQEEQEACLYAAGASGSKPLQGVVRHRRGAGTTTWEQPIPLPGLPLTGPFLLRGVATAEQGQALAFASRGTDGLLGLRTQIGLDLAFVPIGAAAQALAGGMVRNEVTVLAADPCGRLWALRPSAPQSPRGPLPEQCEQVPAGADEERRISALALSADGNWLFAARGRTLHVYHTAALLQPALAVDLTTITVGGQPRSLAHHTPRDLVVSEGATRAVYVLFAADQDKAAGMLVRVSP